MNFKSIFYGVLVGVIVLIAALCLTSCGPDWVVPQGLGVNQPAQPTRPPGTTGPTVVDAGTPGDTDTDAGVDNPCDGGQPIPDTDGGRDGGNTTDAGTSRDGGTTDAGTPLTTDGGSDGGSHCKWVDDDHKEKECCKNGYGWGDKNHCHIHKEN